ncbi:MAG: hypothetical protein PHU85_13510 [Phycisphaerae bacterium]|nr:hypothetical protein [Phycisphaerae bacterium]
MKLPNLDRAIVAQRKIVDYLLCPTHRVGGSKARWFFQFGFRASEWQSLEAALRWHAAIHEVAEIESSPFGLRYIIDGWLETPDGRRPAVRAVWFIDAGENVPRFVTAHPLPRSRA